MTQPTLDVQAVQALADMSQGVIKMAEAYKDRLAAVPKVVDKAEIEKCAATLVEYGWLTAGQKEAAIARLADPTVAVQTLTQLAVKAASSSQDPRLASGHAVPSTNGTHKQAFDGSRYDGESEADRAFLAKQLARRVQTH